MPVAAFIEEVGRLTEVFNLYGDIGNGTKIMTEITARKPCLIFTVGAKAAYIAKIWTKDRQDIPVLFAMVLNWEKYNLTAGQDNIAGIASHVAPGVQFANMMMISPDIRRIGVIYSKAHSAEIIARAQAAADILGLELVTKAIRRPEDFQVTFKKVAEHVEGFWAINDPVAFSVDNVFRLNQGCVKHRLVCVGESKNIAQAGILFAVDPDVPNIGLQAASMAKSILSGNRTPKELGVVPPLGTRLFLNKKTADKIGISLTESAMNMANEIIDK